MKSIRRAVFIFLMFLIPGMHGCEVVRDILDDLLEVLLQTGWLEEKEDMDNIPEDITPFPDEGREIRPSVTLESIFPPIGNQGRFGTCVTWAVGYNLKTSLNAIERGWSTQQLASAVNQTSPKDLWWLIPSNKKGARCEGTNFEPALDALIAFGAKNMRDSPYENLGNCTGTSNGDATNKIANYRKIASDREGLTVDNFKGYLNAGRPIVFGAKLGDRFMTWNNATIISSDTYNNPGMQHAYHAMVLVGYDDDRQAFRVRNSWGPGWGDQGSIWVDYNFFCRNFCFAAFVAQNPVNVSMGAPPSAGYDLLALFADDWEYAGTEHYSRTFEYEVFNSGTIDILPTQRWTATYMYYNAFNASQYEIIFDDYYTDEFGAGDGPWDGARGLAGGWWNNMTLPVGKSVGDGYVIHYVMPPKIEDGFYYLVLMADAYDVIREANEDNNFFFITAENGRPLQFKDGKILNMPARNAMQRSSATKRPAPFSDTAHQTPVVPGNLNAYTPDEIKAMLLHDKKTGRLDAKRRAFSIENQQNNLPNFKRERIR